LSIEEKDRQYLIERRIKKAVNAVDDVQFLIDNDKLVIAVNRI